MLHDTVETTFEDQGSLQRPGLYGRLVRFAIGVYLLYFSFQLIPDFQHFVKNGIPLYGGNLMGLIVIFWVLPYVVNIGWSINSKRMPQYIVVVVSLLLGGLDFVNSGIFYGPFLKIFTVTWFFYVTVHLGISMVLAGLMATPGCEMRAIPQIWARLTGKKTREHFCPGFLNSFDRWERGSDSSSKAQK